MECIYPPVLFHLLKHHLQWIKDFIKENALQGSAVMPAVATQLLKVGNSQMDVYTGTLAPITIASEITQYLTCQQLLEPARYAAWLQEAAGYRLVTLTDRSIWVLRWGEVEEFYVHIHPARHTFNSVRIKASTLKTAVLVSIWNCLHHESPAILTEINLLRKEWLDLPPIRSMEEAEGVRRVMSWLQ